MAPPVREREAPLSNYRQGQCLLDSSIALFMFSANGSPAEVWLDNLFLYAADHSVEPLIVFDSRPRPSGLWLTRISTQGGRIGLLSKAPRTYVASTGRETAVQEPFLFCWFTQAFSAACAGSGLHKLRIAVARYAVLLRTGALSVP